MGDQSKKMPKMSQIDKAAKGARKGIPTSGRVNFSNGLVELEALGR